LRDFFFRRVAFLDFGIAEVYHRHTLGTTTRHAAIGRTDYWYRTAAETGGGLTTGKVFNAGELSAINRGNAERIFPRYRT
jgi:hypothetical protein